MDVFVCVEGYIVVFSVLIGLFEINVRDASSFRVFFVLVFIRVYDPKMICFLLLSGLYFSGTTVVGIMRFVAPTFKGKASRQGIMPYMSELVIILVYRLYSIS